MSGRVGVVVPAHDEEDLVPGCLAAVQVAAAAVDAEVTCLVVLDACRDATAAAAHAAGVRTVSIEAANVGAARAAGVRTLLASGGIDWIATTDADSLVPADWLVWQLRFARAGYDAVVGTVRVVDWQAHPARVRAAYDRAYHHGDGHPHVHGANLGLSAHAYRAARGVPARALAEDAAVIDRLQAAGCRIKRTGRIPVVTSARAVGRAAGGFADHLARLAAAVDPALDPADRDDG